jgi:hypothetical protein
MDDGPLKARQVPKKSEPGEELDAPAGTRALRFVRNSLSLEGEGWGEGDCVRGNLPLL